MSVKFTGLNVGLFVDTQNLYYSAKTIINKQVDYEKLLGLAAQNRLIQQANAYVIEREGANNAFGFVTKLSALGYRVKRKKVRYLQTAEGGHTAIDGDWDMGMAADIVKAWDYLDVIVLASGDGDFVPLLELAQARGRRVEVVAFKDTAHQDLLDLADGFINLADEKDAFVTRE
ncbi:MAG: NYN domain-containing protein [Trueperaceae bacterium]|nr:NYN domain-containing protein [Trueperaceae bacterium]